MGLLSLSTNCVDRAVARANGAARAFICQNFEGNQAAADLRGAALLVDVRLVLIHEVFHRGYDWIWRALPQTAKAVLDNLVAKLPEQRDVFGDALASANP